MAGWANRINQNEQSVVVAVRRNAHHIKEVTGGFSFGPQALFGPREKVTLPLSSVLSSASGFIYPSISTSPETACCTMTGISPSVFPSPARGIVASLTYPDLHALCCRVRFNSPILIICLWKTEAASAPSTSASRKASVKCSMVPAPPEAISGTWQTSRTFSVAPCHNRYVRRPVHHVQDDFARAAFWTSCTQSSVSH